MAGELHPDEQEGSLVMAQSWIYAIREALSDAGGQVHKGEPPRRRSRISQAHHQAVSQKREGVFCTPFEKPSGPTARRSWKPLIWVLNPIRGWANCHRHVVAKNTCVAVDHHI